MKEFSDIIDKILEHIDNYQKSLSNTERRNWFHELYKDEFVTKLTEAQLSIMEKMKDSKDCQTRSSLKEMLDFISTIMRNVEVRKKNRYNIHTGGALRAEGNKLRLELKKIYLSDALI